MFRNLVSRLSGSENRPRPLPKGWTGEKFLSMADADRSAAQSGHGQRGVSLLGLLTDDELKRLNDLLPWSCFILDAQGRAFGKSWSATKRSAPQEIPDYRIVELHRRYPLDNCDVLEVGCFEGVHTVALARLARRVMAADSRVENVVKTVIRCAMLGERPLVFPWNVEDGLLPGVDIACDVLHHVGVLYHLADPVRHLMEVLPHVRRAIMLDTHIASQDSASDSYVSASCRERFRYQRYRESGREEPFAGMEDHAKWLLEEDLIRILRDQGFSDVDVAERRNERNGPRVLIFAGR